MKREREEERQIQELQRLQEASGKPKQLNRVDWMYQAPSSATGHYSEEMEGYLLGKRRIDGILLKNDTDNQKLEKGADVGAHAAAPAGPSIGSQRDTMLKVMADPLLEIRKREQAAQETAMKEAIRRKEREEKRGARVGERDRDRDRRHRARDHDSKRRRYSDDAEDDRSHRSHRSSRRHRSRSPYSPERASRRHRSERDRDDDRERRHDDNDTKSRRDDRPLDRSRDRHEYREKDSHSDRRRDRDDRHARDRDHDRSSGRPRERERDRSPRRSSDQQPPEDRNGRARENDRRGRDFNNQRNGSYGRERAPPSRPAQNRPDPKVLEEERQRKLAEMQCNANDLETDRRQRITDIDAEEEKQREADDKQRSDRGRFMSQVHKRVGEDSLDERIRRSRGGLSKMDEE